MCILKISVVLRISSPTNSTVHSRPWKVDRHSDGQEMACLYGSRDFITVLKSLPLDHNLSPLIQFTPSQRIFIESIRMFSRHVHVGVSWRLIMKRERHARRKNGINKEQRGRVERIWSEKEEEIINVRGALNKILTRTVLVLADYARLFTKFLIMGGELMAERIPILMKYLNLFFVQYNLIPHSTTYILA
jgi:hypothetical protein